MMDIDNVRSWIYQLNDREMRYLRRASLPESYLSLKRKTINDQEIYLFDHGIMRENVVISIHPRFMCVPPHIHDFIEMVYVYSGKFTQIINGKRLTLLRGDMLIVDTGVVHSTERAEDNDIIVTILIRQSFFTNNFLKRILQNGLVSRFIISAIADNKQHGNYLIFNTQKNRRIGSIIDELLIENKTDAENHAYSQDINTVIESYILLLFVELCREWQCKVVPGSCRKNREERIIKILSIIEENYQDLTLSRLAEQFELSPKHLSHLIKSETGCAFKDLIHEKRLERSSILLKSTSMTVFEISIEVGYENLTYFYKKFKGRFGVLPYAYRIGG